MAKRIHNDDAQRAAQGWDRGIGLNHKQQPIPVRFPPAIEALLRAMKDRQDYIRAAVAEKLERDGLLQKDEP